MSRAVLDGRADVAEITSGAGISYRQLDYWTTAGHLRADEASPGSGHRRAWSPSEMAIARAIVRLTASGIILARAAPIARQLVADGETSFELSPGVYIDIERDGGD